MRLSDNQELKRHLELLSKRANTDEISVLPLLNQLGIEHDRYHNGGIEEAIRIALTDGDDPEWISDRIEKALEL